MTEESLFLAALEHSDPADRQAFLEQACGGDAELRRRIELLLAAYAAGKDKLEPAAPASVLTTPEVSPPVPETPIAGRYKLLERIGEGGMGEVWVAKQTEPVQRKVALKLIKPGMDSRQVLTRFEAERQALALMDHPNIAKVLDGGLTADGRPFFVMELVNGLPLTKFCDDAKLTPRERLELFVPVCQAVQHAHQKGIVHRDLKPLNILVTLYDGKPVPKVIDFGVAKATGGKLTAESLSTQFGAVIGTLEYMAPEQAGFSALDVDTRADIYSLGVILYELLTGLRPFDSKRLRKAAVDEAIRIIREEEPPRPSTRLSTDESLPSLAAVRQTEPKRLMALMRGELDWVVMKCLEKDRNRRYETANGLARDVQRYLHDEAVEARPPSAGYKLRKFLRRHKGPVLAAAAMAGLLVLGALISTWQAVRATRAEGVAEARREVAEQAERQANDERDTAEKERRRGEKNEETAQHNLYIANMHRIRFELENNNVSAARALLDLYRDPGTAEAKRRGWEWYYWDRVCHAELHTLKGHLNRVMDVAFSPDGALLASAGGDGDPVVKIWDTVTGDELHALRGHEYLVSQVAFSPDSKVFATCSIARGTVKLWDVATWTEVFGWKPEPEDKFLSVAFSPDGKTLALADARSKRVKIWDLVGMRWAGQLPEGTTSSRIQFSPDGNLIAAVKADGVRLWDVNRQTLLRTLRGHSFLDVESGGQVSEAITGLAFSPDGQLLATCSRDGTMKIRKVRDGTEVRSITVMSARVAALTGLEDLAFSPDGKYLVTSGVGTPLKLWEVGTGREVRSFFGQASAECVSFSPDGTRLASAGPGGVVKIWDAAGEPGQHLFLDEMNTPMSPRFSPDGKLLAERYAYGAKIGQVHVRDADTGRLVATLDHKPSRVTALAFSSDGTHIATASQRRDQDVRQASREVRLWNLSSRQEVGVITGFNDSIIQLAFSPGDRLLASVVQLTDPNTRKRTGEVKIWDVKTRKEQRSLPGMAMDFSPNGTIMAVVGNDESIELFEVGTGQRLRAFPSRAGRASVAFSPDGNQLCDGSAVWEVADGREVCALKGNDVPARFSPDGKRLFSLKSTSRSSGVLRVWDATTGDLLASIPVQASGGLSVHPDGWRCAVVGFSTGTWVVDARPLTPELRIKRDAHNLVAHLICKPMLKDELLDQLARMKTISEPLRREALALAAAVEIPSWVFVYAAWDIVLYPDRSEEQYRRALRWLEEANRISPNDGEVLNELGMALYRLGRFEDAAVTLEKAFKINTSGSFSAPAGDLVFLAMSQHRLGRQEEARKTLAQARGPRMMAGGISPHVWREAEALIEGKAAEPEK